ncbi:MAG TPA: arginine--tRNA ligase [Candidatus Paceibacterota bacterium]
MKELLAQSIRDSLQVLGITSETFSVEQTDNFTHGDYATNVALVAAKSQKRNPKELAREIADRLSKKLPKGVERVEVAGPGFLNFFLSREYFSDTVKEILADEKDYGRNKTLKGKKVMVEYTDPNPFKELHIGHLMSNTIGESIARLFEAQGAVVKRACYQGDVGLHVAKAIWGMQSVPTRDDMPLEKLSLEAKMRYLGHAYQLGAAAYEDGRKDDIEMLNRMIYDRSDQAVNKLYIWGRKISLEYFEEQYKKLGTKFDFFFFESEAAPTGKEVVEKGLKGGIFEKSDLPAPGVAPASARHAGWRQAGGAVIFRAEKHDQTLHTRVFVNSQGLPTYEAKELGLALMKEREWHHDASIVITGNEVNDYFRVLLAAMKLVLPELAEKTEHLSHGMLRLPTGKMSSRKGEVITADSLIMQIAALVEKKIEERDYSDEQKASITDKVSVGAIKYSILRQAVGGDIIFDFDKSISFEGDSGPYLQYAATRAQSVLLKAKKEGIKASVAHVPAEVVPFERLLSYFPETVARAAREFAPHLLVTYLIELAGAFNSFYAHEQIVSREDEHSSYKVALTTAFRVVMENGLGILGVSIPEKM